MVAMLGATVFFGGAVFSLVVIVQMLRAYRPTIMAALNGQPLPRTMPVSLRLPPQRPIERSFTPRRIEPVHAAA